MDYSYVFNNKILNKENLINYGFIKNKDGFEFFKQLSDDNLQLQVYLNEKEFYSNVIDLDFGEEFLPIKQANASGYVLKMQKEVEEIIEDIIENCFIDDSMRIKVLNYVKEKYNVLPFASWPDDYPNYATLKAPNGKWFGLLMKIKKSILNGEEENLVDVINIKLDPKEIQELIDNKNFFLAYHMNKKYWITILLDNNIEEDKLYKLIDESYEAVL